MYFLSFFISILAQLEGWPGFVTPFSSVFLMTACTGDGSQDRKCSVLDASLLSRDSGNAPFFVSLIKNCFGVSSVSS